MVMLDPTKRPERRMRRVVLVGALAVLLSLSVVATPAWARMYAYTDNQGRIRITDIPEREGAELVLPRIGVPTSGGTASSSASVTPVRRRASSAPSGRAAVRYDPQTFRASVRAAAATHRVSESLIYAVMRAESNFNPYAISSAGAQGLMQLIPSTARNVGVSNTFDPHQNIHGGAKYLRMMLDRFGRVDLALAAYNAGPEAVERYGGIPPFAETLQYVPRVMRFYREFGGAGELVLSAIKPLIASRGRSTTSSARSRPTVRSASAKITEARAATTPLWYYRGPDGQIYISNIGN